MKIKEIQHKILENQNIKNIELLNICNLIEFHFIKDNINYLGKMNFYNNNNELFFIENIHVLIESTFSKFHLKLSCFKENENEFNFKNDYKILNNEFVYLKDIINFYKPFIKDKNLLNDIQNLNIDNKISNIENFYYKL